MNLDATTMTDEEVYKQGIRALSDRLGIDGMIRFVQIQEKGEGDYTEERQAWVHEPIVDIIHEDGLTSEEIVLQFM